jgi:hypothetical protein
LKVQPEKTLAVCQRFQDDEPESEPGPRLVTSRRADGIAEVERHKLSRIGLYQTSTYLSPTPLSNRFEE